MKPWTVTFIFQMIPFLNRLCSVSQIMYVEFYVVINLQMQISLIYSECLVNISRLLVYLFNSVLFVSCAVVVRI